MNSFHQLPTYWLLQFTHTPSRHEPKNIGVFLHDGISAHCRLIGENGSKNNPYGLTPPCDLRYFCHVFDVTEAEGWIFLEWVNWFHTMADDHHISIDQVQSEFDRLNRSSNQFTATVPYINLELKTLDPDAAADLLFESLVASPNPLPSTHPFDDILFKSELKFMEDFHRDVEVEIGEGDDISLVFFDVVLEKPVPLGIALIRFQDMPDMTTISHINNALYSFETSQSLGFLTPDRCIVLHDSPSPLQLNHLNRLEKHARLLPISDPSTPKTLQQIALHPSPHPRSS